MRSSGYRCQRSTLTPRNDETPGTEGSQGFVGIVVLLAAIVTESDPIPQGSSGG
jgi:hypothetical protein